VNVAGPIKFRRNAPCLGMRRGSKEVQKAKKQPRWIPSSGNFQGSFMEEKRHKVRCM